METLFSVKQAAKALGEISPWTIYAWLSQGKLKKVKIGSRTMIAASELERFISEGSRKR
jgi:excisionase family DNA binding protein